MYLPCIDGAWDKSRWGQQTWEAAQRDRYSHQDTEYLQFWPLTAEHAAGSGGSVLSGDYVHQWSVVAQQMARQGGNDTFDGRLTLSSFWSDFHTRPTDYFDKITGPVLWVMATEDVVCGPLEFTKGWYGNLKGEKEICVLEGEHLPQYFDAGFAKGVEAMLKFLGKHAT
jgi:hypothetical protein